jgi:hypothetical protein
MSQRILFTEQVQDLGGNSLPSLLSTAANGKIIVASANQNFNNTSTVNVAVTANGVQANVTWTINAAAVAACVSAVMLSTVNTATAGQNVVPLVTPLTSNANYLLVTVNGIVQIPGVHYTLPNSGNVVMSDALLANDVVEAREFIAPYAGSSSTSGPPPFGTFISPNMSAWLTANDNQATVNAIQNADGSMVLSALGAPGVAGNTVFFYSVNAPATYDVQFCLTTQGNNIPSTGLPLVAMWVRNPANGSTISFGSSGSAAWSTFDELRLTSKVQTVPSSFAFVSSSGNGTMPYIGPYPLWIRLVNSGSGVYKVYNSIDGIFWYLVLSLTDGYAGPSPSQFGFLCFTCTDAQLRFLSYNGAVG